jgi:hypothetical protein
MFLDYQYCPHCKGIRKMSQSIAMLPLSGARQGLALCLHCDSCFSYVGQIPYPETAQEPFTASIIEEKAGVSAA